MSSNLERPGSVLVAHLFPRLGDELLALLASLTPVQWELPTVCSAWKVRDIAAHLLDSACRRLSFERDGFAPPLPSEPISDHKSLVGFLDELNAQWVGASRRLSPGMLMEFLQLVEPQLARHVASLDPVAPAMFPVSWAGEEESRAWFDVARELTERWHHQQQIRLAVGAPSLDDPDLVEPVFETFLRAWPHHYVNVEATAGTTLVLEIEGAKTYGYSLRREGSSWNLLLGSASNPDAAVHLSEQAAWLLFTKGMSGEVAIREAAIEGNASLVKPLFRMIAVMA